MVRVNGGVLERVFVFVCLCVCVCLCVHTSGGTLKGGEASQDLVCDHHRHGTVRRAHGLLRESPQEGESITEPVGVSSKQLSAERANERGRLTRKLKDTQRGRDRDCNHREGGLERVRDGWVQICKWHQMKYQITN